MAMACHVMLLYPLLPASRFAYVKSSRLQGDSHIHDHAFAAVGSGVSAHSSVTVEPPETLEPLKHCVLNYTAESSVPRDQSIIDLHEHPLPLFSNESTRVLFARRAEKIVRLKNHA